MVVNPYQADAAFIGYVFQGMYALILLLDAEDEESVSIETADDVVLSSKNETLYQLKHSLKRPPKLTIKSDGFWKTIRIWANNSDISSTKFVFVTSAKIDNKSELLKLSVQNTDRNAVTNALEKEASFVLQKIAEAQQKKKKLPYSDRAGGCTAFLALSVSERQLLVDRITIKPQTFNASQITEEVCKRLSITTEVTIRTQVAERLIEWWDRQVTLSLLNKRSRLISKVELQRQIQELIYIHRRTSLPDDFSWLQPDSLATELGGIMEEQIKLVKGGPSRITRAATARWRARNQRQRWMDSDISIAAKLSQLDEKIEETWRDIHGPMVDDCCNSSPDVQCDKGLKILDWSHSEAPQQIVIPWPDWREAFLVQGTLQQLADELRVGWHPHFKQLIKQSND